MNQLPDWDAYFIINEGNVYTDRESLLEELILIKEDIDEDEDDFDYVIELERCQLILFNIKIKQVEHILSCNSNINIDSLAKELVIDFLCSYSTSDDDEWKIRYLRLDLLEQVKNILLNPVPDRGSAQSILTQWCCLNSTVDGGRYRTIGETVEIDLRQLSDYQWNYASENSVT